MSTKGLDNLFWIVIAILFILLIVLGYTVKAEGAFTVFVFCQEEAPQGTHVWFGYTSDQNGEGTYVDYNPPAAGPGIYFTDVQAGTFNRVADAFIAPGGYVRFGIDTYFGSEFVMADATWTGGAPECSAALDPVQGGLNTITLAVGNDTLFHWQIRDVNGNWNDIIGVTTPVEYDADGAPFTRLVLGNDNPDTNPENYRVFPVGGE